ncbi:ABC transporter substrate-binding protein [Synergistales bacterium]|nr:ABC transporter substrate-binding protein [Synergistales bacterium]
MKKQSNLFSFMLILTLFVCGFVTSNSTFAADSDAVAKFPEKRIEIIASFGPGSGVDITSRALAGPLSRVLGVDVIVTNIEGSQGLVGTEHAYNQAADGYTIFLTTQTHLITQVYGLSDIIFTKEFEPVCRMLHDVTVVSTNPKGRFKTFEELSAFAKEHPNEVKVAGVAPTGLDGMIVKQFIQNSGVPLDMVAFSNSSECKSALLGNHVDLSVDDIVSTSPLVQAGELIGMMVLAEKRVEQLPEIPCSVELGINATIGAWRGISVRRGTDPAIVDKLEQAIIAAMKDPEWLAFVDRGMMNQRQGFASTGDFAKIWDEEMAFFTKLADIKK